MKVPLAGGAPLHVCDAPTRALAGASWLPDGTIILATLRSGLHSVNASGGTLRPLSDVEERISARWPYALPDGEHILFTDPDAENGIALLSLTTGDWKVIKGLGPGGGATYVETGHLLYVQSGTLMAVPFDPAAGEVRGSPVPVVEGVAPAFDSASYAVTSSTGSTSSNVSSRRRISPPGPSKRVVIAGRDIISNEHVCADYVKYILPIVTLAELAASHLGTLDKRVAPISSRGILLAQG